MHIQREESGVKLKTVASVISAGIMAATVAQAETELTVYTAVEAEDLKRYAEMFNVQAQKYQ